MKTIGCLAVHYGKEYIAWAVRGLAQAVDEVHAFYTPSPSFGHYGDLPNPDTEEELVAEANRFAKVEWHRITAYCEGEHREHMLLEAQRRSASMMAIADADEVWDSAVLAVALRGAYDSNSNGRWMARFHNFWRSWNWTVKDHFTPIRIVDMRHPLTSDTRLEIFQTKPIYHFGYAQCLATMRYKMSCHGHKAEFKPNWLEERFEKWHPITNNSDLHPCINNFWHATETDEEVLGELARLMPEHPYRGKMLIA